MHYIRKIHTPLRKYRSYVSPDGGYNYNKQKTNM